MTGLHGRFVDRSLRRRRYSATVYGRGGANPDTTLLGLAAVVLGGVVLVLVLLSTTTAPRLNVVRARPQRIASWGTGPARPA